MGVLLGFGPFLLEIGILRPQLLDALAKCGAAFLQRLPLQQVLGGVHHFCLASRHVASAVMLGTNAAACNAVDFFFYGASPRFIYFPATGYLYRIS